MNIDTVKIKQCGKDIVELTKELNEIIDDLYTKLINISANGQWQGNSAIAYSNKASLERLDALEFTKKLTEYGVGLMDLSTKYENTINNTIV